MPDVSVGPNDLQSKDPPQLAASLRLPREKKGVPLGRLREFVQGYNHAPQPLQAFIDAVMLPLTFWPIPGAEIGECRRPHDVVGNCHVASIRDSTLRCPHRRNAPILIVVAAMVGIGILLRKKPRHYVIWIAGLSRVRSFEPHERPPTSPLTDRPEVRLEQERIALAVSISTALIETGARRIKSRSGARHLPRTPFVNQFRSITKRTHSVSHGERALLAIPGLAADGHSWHRTQMTRAANGIFNDKESPSLFQSREMVPPKPVSTAFSRIVPNPLAQPPQAKASNLARPISH